jgi:hypothetical protein
VADAVVPGGGAVVPGPAAGVAGVGGRPAPAPAPAHRRPAPAGPRGVEGRGKRVLRAARRILSSQLQKSSPQKVGVKLNLLVTEICSLVVHSFY